MTITPLPHPNKIQPVPLSRRQIRFSFGVLLAINVLNYADRYVLPAVLPKIHHDLGLSALQEGLLGSSFLLVYALAALPLGMQADRSARTRIIASCVAVWSVATFFVGAARNFGQLLGLRTVLGIGEAGYGPASQSLIADYFPHAKRARMLSLWTSGNLLGAAVGFTLGGLIADAFGWRWAFYIVGIPGLAMALLAMRMAEPRRGASDTALPVSTLRASVNPPSLTLSQIVRTCLRIPTFWAILAAGAGSAFTIGGTSFWLPSYIVETFHLSVGTAGIISGGVLVTSGLIGTVAGGWLADHLQRRRSSGRLLTAALGFILGAPLILLALSIHTLPWFIAVFIGAGISLSLCSGPLLAVGQDIIAPNMRSTALGLMMLITHVLGDASAPTVIGLIATHHNLHIALMLTAPIGLALAGIACLFGLRSVSGDML